MAHLRLVRFALPLIALLLTAAPVLAGDETPHAPGQARAAQEKPDDPIPTLREAVLDGKLEAFGDKPSSYRRVHLHLENRTAAPLSVDICGSYLEPRSKRSCQRLGLGPVVTPRAARKAGPGTVVVDLGPGETKTLEVHTCCLDAGRPAPSQQLFRPARGRLPDVREGVLRWWADHPQAPQGAVNSAIWQSRPDVYWDPNNRQAVRQVRSYAHAAASNAGTRYLLKNGELMSRDPDGILRFLGTDIRAVHPTDSAVYAEAYGRPLSRTAPRPRELWRLVPTGDEPWRLVATLPGALRIRELRVGPTGAVLLVAADGLYRVYPELRSVKRLVETPENDSLSIRFLRRGRVQYTLRTKSDTGYYQGGELKGAAMPVLELWTLDLATEKTERTRKFWNVQQVRMGAAGVFALTPGGKLRRLHGKSFRTIGGTISYERILLVGRKYVWVESRKGRLVTVSPSGTPRFQNGPRALDAYALDRHTDEVVYAHGSKYWAVEPSKGKREEIEGS